MEANSSDLSLLDDIDKEILILSIDIGDGRKDVIKVHEKSSADKLAIEFCSKHRLGAKAKIALADEIEKNLAITSIKAKLSEKIESTPTRSTKLFSSPYRSISTTGELTDSTTKKPPVLSEYHSNCSTNYAQFCNPNPMKKPLTSSTLPLANTLHKKSYSSIVRPILSGKRQDPEFKPCNGNKSIEKIKVKSSINSPIKCQSQERDTYKSPHGENEASGFQQMSEKIVGKIKAKRYREVFTALHPDRKGNISHLTILHNSLDPAILGIITPLLNEIKLMKESLNFQEFFDSMEQLMKVLTPTEKAMILMTAKHKEEKDGKKTNHKKAQKHLNGVVLGLYERGILKKIDTWKRIMHEKEEKEKQEMQECRFKPTICQNRKKLRNSGKFENANEEKPENNI